MWTNKWPTRPGWYWFYGRHYGEEKHSLAAVRVVQISNGLIYILNGHGMHKSDGHKGVFHSAVIPAVSAKIAGGDFGTPEEKKSKMGRVTDKTHLLRG